MMSDAFLGPATCCSPVLREAEWQSGTPAGVSRLDTPTGSHIAKRDVKGRFKEMDNVGRSLEADRRTKAKISVKSGHGEQGDRKRSG